MAPGVFVGFMKIAAGSLYMRPNEDVVRIPLSGGSAQILRQPGTAGYDGDIDSDGTHLYWDEFGDFNPFRPAPTLACLGKMAMDGSGMTCLEQGLQSFGAVRVDDSRLYFIRDHQVLSRPK